MRTKKRKWPKVLALLIVLAAAAAFVLQGMLAPKTATSGNQIVHTVSRGDVDVTITGSGRMERADSSSVDLPAGVEVAAVFAEEGDLVHAGDILAALDADSLEYRAAQLSGELAALDMQLAARRDGGEIVSPVKGRIKAVYADEDADVIETVNAHGALAVLSTDGLMQVEIETEASIALNAEVEVKWTGGSEDGTVAARTEDGYLITIDDEDAPYLAKADVYYQVEKIGSGVLEIHAPLTVFGNGGVIEEIHKDVNDAVTPGAKIFSLSGEPAADSYRQTLYQRNLVAEDLQTVLGFIARPNVVADEDGVVESVFVEEDGVVPGVSGNTQAFVIGTGGAVMMTVNVDELDIGDVQVGQSVEVTLDAFAGESFDAHVTRISQIGMPSGSITTYAVEIETEADSRFRQGMNGSAVIYCDGAKDVLLVPLAAVQEDAQGEYVNVLHEDGTTSQRYIETGLSDGTMAEVVQGVSEGDQIVYRGAMNAMLLMQQKMMENQAAMFGGEME